MGQRKHRRFAERVRRRHLIARRSKRHLYSSASSATRELSAAPDRSDPCPSEHGSRSGFRGSASMASARGWRPRMGATCLRGGERAAARGCPSSFRPLMTAPERTAAPGASAVEADPRTPRAIERLRRPRDFEAVMRQGRRTRGPMLYLAARPNQLPYSRVGYAVSRRVGSAVVRNRVKRRLREIMRELPIRAGYDIVTVPQHSSVRVSFQELRAATAESLGRLKLLTPENESVS